MWCGPGDELLIRIWELGAERLGVIRAKLVLYAPKTSLSNTQLTIRARYICQLKQDALVSNRYVGDM